MNQTETIRLIDEKEQIHKWLAFWNVHSPGRERKEERLRQVDRELEQILKYPDGLYRHDSGVDDKSIIHGGKVAENRNMEATR